MSEEVADLAGGEGDVNAEELRFVAKIEKSI